MPTFLEMQTEVLARGFDATAHGTRILNWLYEANRIFHRQIRGAHSEAAGTLVTSNGVSTVNAPADLGDIRSVRFAGASLEPMTIEDLEDLSTVARGRPTAYAVIGSTLKLWPTPNGVFTLDLRYWSVPTNPASGSTPAFPEEYHRILELWALRQAYLSEDDFEAADRYGALWNERLAQARNDLQYREANSHRQVAGMWQGRTGITFVRP